MSPFESLAFPCTQCGACCRHVNLSEMTTYLDRGDGVCRHHDLTTQLCRIYDDRPEICRVEVYYKKYLKEKYSWESFVKLNLISCKQLEELD